MSDNLVSEFFTLTFPAHPALISASSAMLELLRDEAQAAPAGVGWAAERIDMGGRVALYVDVTYDEECRLSLRCVDNLQRRTIDIGILKGCQWSRSGAVDKA